MCMNERISRTPRNTQRNAAAKIRTQAFQSRARHMMPMKTKNAPKSRRAMPCKKKEEEKETQNHSFAPVSTCAVRWLSSRHKNFGVREHVSKLILHHRILEIGLERRHLWHHVQ